MRLKLLFTLGACLAAAACGTFSDGGPPMYGSRGAAGLHGSPLVRALSSEARGALDAAFDTALRTGAPGAARAWSADGARGTVTPGAAFLQNIFDDPSQRIAVRAGVDASRTLETDLGDYVLTRNANIRLGPDTKTKAVEVLSAGTAVDALGRVVTARWLLIAYQGQARGYVYEPLATPAPGAELALAGGPRRAPVLCRAYEERITVSGKSDRWSGFACRTPDGQWRADETRSES